MFLKLTSRIDIADDGPFKLNRGVAREDIERPYPIPGSERATYVVQKLPRPTTPKHDRISGHEKRRLGSKLWTRALLYEEVKLVSQMIRGYRLGGHRNFDRDSRPWLLHNLISGSRVCRISVESTPAFPTSNYRAKPAAPFYLLHVTACIQCLVQLPGRGQRINNGACGTVQYNAVPCVQAHVMPVPDGLKPTSCAHADDKLLIS